MSEDGGRYCQPLRGEESKKGGVRWGVEESQMFNPVDARLDWAEGRVSRSAQTNKFPPNAILLFC